MESFKRAALILLACIALSAGVYAGLSKVVQRQNASASVTKAVCLAQNKQTLTLTNLLVFFQGRSLENPTLTAAQKKAVTEFYAGAIKQLPVQAIC